MVIQNLNPHHLSAISQNKRRTFPVEDIKRWCGNSATIKITEKHNSKVDAFEARRQRQIETVDALLKGDYNGHPLEVSDGLRKERLSLAGDSLQLLRDEIALLAQLRKDWESHHAEVARKYLTAKQTTAADSLARVGGLSRLAEEIASASPELRDLRGDYDELRPHYLEGKSAQELLVARFAVAQAILDTSGLRQELPQSVTYDENG